MQRLILMPHFDSVAMFTVLVIDGKGVDESEIVTSSLLGVHLPAPFTVLGASLPLFTLQVTDLRSSSLVFPDEVRSALSLSINGLQVGNSYLLALARYFWLAGWPCRICAAGSIRHSSPPTFPSTRMAEHIACCRSVPSCCA